VAEVWNLFLVHRCVIAGLDPTIHDAHPRVAAVRILVRRLIMDAIRTRACPSSAKYIAPSRVNPTWSVEPGHDGKNKRSEQEREGAMSQKAELHNLAKPDGGLFRDHRDGLSGAC
jgi:hypothetical protein